MNMQKMVINKYVTFLFICLIAPVCSQAQFLNYGTDPSRYRWNKVDLEHYSLIYPQGLDSMASRYASYLENAYPHIRATIGTPVKASFPVILHPANMISNGMVAWTPRRMELLTTPSPRQQAEPWDLHLVLHESRHVLQAGKLMNGIFRPLYYLMGEQAAGLASAFVPTWFFEGDAVSTETALTGAGRGRLPEFQLIYRTQMLSGSFFSFDKWNMGSYKDNTGTFYTLGYNLTAFARYKYGADIWDKTTTRYVNHLISFPTFSNAFKHHTGAGTSQLFNETFDFLKAEWAGKDSAYIVPDYLSPDVKKFTSYQYAQALNDSTVVSLKSSFHDIPALVAITNGKERRLAYPGNISSRLSTGNHRIYWTEYVPGLRWSLENKAVLKYYDTSTARTGTLAPRQGRNIAVALNDSLVASSQFSETGESRLVLLHAESGSELRRYAPPGNAFIKDLAWADAHMLCCVAVSDAGISLLALNTETGLWDTLLGPTQANITSPVCHDGQVYFESGLDGINNIYALDLHSRQAYRLTSARFGAFQPAVSADGKKLIYADYQAKGYRIASLATDSLLRQAADFSRPELYTLAENLTKQEGFQLNPSALEPVAFHPRPYRKLAHLFHVHSWAPLYYNVNDMINVSSADFTTAVKPGATLISQNALNTAVTQAGWYYEEGNHHGVFNFTYMGWLPVIQLNADYGGKAYDMLWMENEQKEQLFTPHLAGRSLLEVETQAYIPLNLSGGQYVRGIQPSLSYYFTNNRYQQYQSGRLPYFQYMLSELRFYLYRKMAQQEILPRWGFQLRLQQLNAPFHTDNYGSLSAGRLTTYWPGILRTHSLMVRMGYQYQNMENKYLYFYKQLLETPRGHHYLYRTHQQLALKADYAFPVLMPDLSLGAWAYLRRLRANLFYDLTYNQEKSGDPWHQQSSFGTDILFDWNALRFTYPLVTGLRLIQPDGAPFQVRALFSISF